MKTLREQLENIGCNDIEEKIALFEGYRKAILEANKSINLTRITDPEEFEKRHFAESLIPCSDLVFQGAERIIDVGSGAGFPGVPIAIAFPDKEVVFPKLPVLSPAAGQSLHTGFHNQTHAAHVYAELLRPHAVTS